MGIKEKVNNSITKIEKEITPWKIGRKEWHSKDWKREKKYLRKMMRRWKKGKISQEEFCRIRKDHKRWCEEERRRHEEEEEENIKAIRIE